MNKKIYGCLLLIISCLMVFSGIAKAEAGTGNRFDIASGDVVADKVAIVNINGVDTKWEYAVFTYNEANTESYDVANLKFIGVTEGDYAVHVKCLTPELLTGVVDIPEKLDGYPVYDLAKDAIKDAQGVTGLNFPSTLKKLQENAINHLENLKTLNFNKAKVRFEWNPVYDCQNIDTVYGEGVSEVGGALTFSSKSKIKNFVEYDNLYYEGSDIENFIMVKDQFIINTRFSEGFFCGSDDNNKLTFANKGTKFVVRDSETGEYIEAKPEDWNISDKVGTISCFAGTFPEEVAKLHNIKIEYLEESKAENTYEVIDGKDQVVNVSTDGEIKIRIDADYNLFLYGGSLYIDGVLIPKEGYKVESGSTIITILNDYAKQLTDGKHEIKALFGNGREVVNSVTITTANSSAPAPDTFDGIYVSISAICIAAAGIILVSKNKKAYLK